MSYTASYIVNSSSAQGTTDFQFTFPYIKEEHIEVYLNYSKLTQGSGSNQYQVITNVSPKLIRLNTGTASANLRVEVRRNSSLGSPLVDYADGSTLTANDLDTSALQSLYIDQELKDNQGKTVSVDEATGLPSMGESSAGNLRLTKVADPTAAQDAATKNYVDTKVFTSSQIQDGTITSADIADGTIVNADVNASAAIAGSKLQASTSSNAGSMSAADKAKIDGIETGATADQTNAEIRAAVEAATDSNVFTDADHTKLNAIEANATADQTNAEIRAAVEAATDSNVFTDADHTKLNGIETAATADQTAAEIKTAYESNAQTNPLTDAEKAVIDGVTANTSELNKLDGVTASTAELNIVAGKTFKTSSGTLDTTSDTEIPSSKVIAAHVASSQTAIGGFVTIADEVSFPTTANMPANGVVVSINNAAGVVVNGSGVSTTGRTTDGTPATVTINGFPSSLNGETLAAGVGLMVTATSTSNTYSYHKILAAETDVKQLSDDINDFNARYRVAGSAPGSSNDAGDLYFDTSANKMKVYNGTTNAWDDVASVGNFYINTISSSSGTGGGSATFNGSAYRFTLSNPPTMAQQLIVSVNGVIQKPNSGTSQPSEGFAISGNDIIFSAAPASGSDYFIVTQGSSVSIGTPSDNTVTAGKIVDGSIANAKISNSANIAGSKLADDSISEVKLDIHNAPSGTDKFLKYTANGMEWAVDNNTVYTHPNHSGEVTSSADGAQTIADDVVDEANLKISNAGTNGQFLQKQSGNTGGLTWADAGGGIDSDAQKNTVGGTNAGDSFTGTDSTQNTLIGYDAGTANTTGDNNTFIGSEAGQANIAASESVAIGSKALKAASGSSGMTAVGYQALTTANTSGSDIPINNTAVGKDSLRFLTTGTNNTALGYGSGMWLTTGSTNVALGYQAIGATAVTGSSNIGIGKGPLGALTSGTHNLAIGDEALETTTTGTYNVAIGQKSLEELGAGCTGNTAVGRRTARGMQNGGYNTFIGYQAGPYTSTSDVLWYNTCVGNYAGFSLTSGDYNIGIGHDALQHDSPSGAVTTQNGILCLGSDQITDFYCEDTSISSSDKRDKTDITDFTHGLKWINQLKPVTYRWDKRTWYKEYNEDGSIKAEPAPDGSKKKPRQHIGFLAQDVLAIEQADGFASKKDDMLIVNINEDETRYGLKYERLVPVLVNAIKELSAKVETLETKVAALEAK